MVQSCDSDGTETLRDRNDGGVNESEVQVTVGCQQLSASSVAVNVEVRHLEAACGDGIEEPRFVSGPEPAIEHDAGLGQDRRGEKKPCLILEQFSSGVMRRVAFVGSREQNARVDDEHRRSISSC